MARERVVRGSNRGGKTLPSCIELARATLGLDPFNKYPKRDGRAYIVGRDEKHLGETIWQKLGKAGAFRIVKDPVSDKWRSFRPWTDNAIRHLSRPAPPILTPSAIVAMSWKKKAAGVPEKIVLNTGWEILFFSSLGKPPRGMDLDLVWFDEEIVDQEWYSEMAARLVDRGGRFFWSATPQSGTEQLLELHERAALQATWEHPLTTEHFVHVRDNPHIANEEKVILQQKMTSEMDYHIRWEGEFIILTARIYPEWDEKLHCCQYFSIPPHWTIYVSVDPGRQVCACLFAAVPAPEDEQAGRIFFFDEIYIRNANKQLFGEAMKQRLPDLGRQAHAFIIDRHGGKISDGATGLSYREHYSRELKKMGVRSNQTGNDFWLSSDNPEADTEAARAWLIPKDHEDPDKCVPILSVMSEKCPNFCREIKKYRHPREKVGDRFVVTDKIPHKGDVHQMDNLRYLAAHGLVWVPPQGGTKKKNWILDILAAKRAKSREGSADYIRLGPGNP